MSWFKSAALIATVATASAAIVSSASAADLISYPVSTEEALPIIDDVGFDWSGFYVGVYGVGQISAIGGNQYGLGLALGANAQLDMFVLGAEVSAHGLTEGNLPTTTSYGQVIAKAGVLVTDDILLYAAGGYGIDLGPPDESHALFGGGVEMAVSDNVSLNAQYLHGFPLTGGNPMDQVTIGAKFHF